MRSNSLSYLPVLVSNLSLLFFCLVLSRNNVFRQMFCTMYCRCFAPMYSIVNDHPIFVDDLSINISNIRQYVCTNIFHALSLPPYDVISSSSFHVTLRPYVSAWLRQWGHSFWGLVVGGSVNLFPTHA